MKKYIKNKKKVNIKNTNYIVKIKIYRKKIYNNKIYIQKKYIYNENEYI